MEERFVYTTKSQGYFTNSLQDDDEETEDIRHFQHVLRKFPPRPNKDPYTTEFVDVSCADCGAIFSSELALHSSSGCEDYLI